MEITDSAGRKWEPEVNVVTIGRVRDRLGINLLELLVPDNTLATKLVDPCLLADVLFLLCKDAADAIGVDDVAFGRSLTMDSIEQAWSVVLEGLVLFSPRGIRPAHQRVLEKARAYQKAAADRVAATVAHPEFDRMLDREISRLLSGLETSPTESTGDASSLPASSASSPGETRSAV